MDNTGLQQHKILHRIEPALWQAIHLLPLLLVNCFRESVCCPKQNIHILTSFVAEQVLMQLKKPEFTRSLIAEGGGDGGRITVVGVAEPPWMCCRHPAPPGRGIAWMLWGWALASCQSRAAQTFVSNADLKTPTCSKKPKTYFSGWLPSKSLRHCSTLQC